MIARAHIRWWMSPILALLLTGCATSSPAPVERRALAQQPQASPAATSPSFPAPLPPPQVQTFPAPEQGEPRASSAQYDSSSEQPARLPFAPSAGATPRSPVRSDANPAVIALLDRANEDSGSGRHDTASASLERAIKIEPGNAWLWHRLAATRLAQGRPGEAASLAAKSNTLAAGDPGLQSENWLLIARVHEQRGEDVAARAAQQRARELSAPAS